MPPRQEPASPIGDLSARWALNTDSVKIPPKKSENQGHAAQLASTGLETLLCEQNCQGPGQDMLESHARAAEEAHGL